MKINYVHGFLWDAITLRYNLDMDKWIHIIGLGTYNY